MVTSLQRKLLRDLLGMKSQVLAIALVLSCGVGALIMSICTAVSLRETMDAYYARQNFADIFAHAKRAPLSLVDRIAEIPGVARVYPRIVAEVKLDIPDLPEPATGRLVSLPEFGEPLLNGLHLRQGRLVEPGRAGEVVLNEAFATAHGLVPGDSLAAVINGRREALRVAGIALSPEFVYQIRPGEIFPDDKRFGVLWMGRSQMEAAFDLEGAWNDVVVSLMHGASEERVITSLDTLTAPYGGQGAYPRSQQVSHRYVSDELTQLRAMATIPPAIFLGVAAFLLNVVIHRLVRSQRVEIAMLKSFGYDDREVAWHYLGFALVITVLGLLIGVALGALMGRGMTSMYVQFFHFPELHFQLNPWVLGMATLASLGAGIFGTLGAVRKAAALPPAEAMRPEAPATYRATLVERLGLGDLLSPTAVMVLRQIQRQPVKALMSILGVALAIALLILGSFTADIIGDLLDLQFFTAQRQDMMVTFIESPEETAVHELEQLPGVHRVEPWRNVAVRLRHGPRSRRLGLMGLPADRTLLRPMDFDRREISLPPEGLVISQSLAGILDAVPGDRVTLEVLEGHRTTLEVSIVGVVEDFSGTSAYMDLAGMNRLLADGALISGAMLTFDAASTGALYAAVKDCPNIAGSTLKLAALHGFEKTMSESLLRMRLFNTLFAGIIAFGVVYNAARISLSERAHELATLRVIGFTRGEVSSILLGEVGLLTLLAIAPGLLIGRGLAAITVIALATETQRFPLVVLPSTYGFAVVVVVASSVISALVVRRRIDHLDLLAVLKSHE